MRHQLTCGAVRNLRRLFLMCIPLVTVCSDEVQAATPRIQWQVVNPFRLFLNPAATELHRAALPRNSAEDAAPVLAAERTLSEQFQSGWAADTRFAVCYDPRRQTYQCNATPDYLHPVRHAVRIWVAAAPSQTCNWSFAAEGSAPKRVSPCAQGIVVEIPYPVGLTVRVEVSGASLQDHIAVEDLFVMALGDSYASGDGNPDRPVLLSATRALNYGPSHPTDLTGYPTRSGAWDGLGDREFLRAGPGWMEAACARSLYGYPARAALLLAVENPHRAVTFASFACWGADIVQGLFQPYPASPLVPLMPRLGQLSAAATAQCAESTTLRSYESTFTMSGTMPELSGITLHSCRPHKARRIDLLLLSVGGNDIGFSQLLAHAVLADASLLRDVGGWLGQLREPDQALRAVRELPHRFKALNRALHTVLRIPWSEPDRIMLVGYPTLALRDDGRSPCPSGPAGMTILPDYRLDASRTIKTEEVGTALYRAMAEIARAHGWSFVDEHRAQFAGRGVCAGAYGGIVDAADDVRLPRWSNGAWRPYSPTEWRPFASRKRWIRTPNDGFLTVHFHGPSSEASPLQLILASAYSGAFHPTAEGHAAIADAVVRRARDVLARPRIARKPS